MNISEVTRRDIIDFLLEDCGVFYGRLKLMSFLERVWDLNSMPSTDRRYSNAAGDIWQHMVNNNDYTDHDLLYDILNITACDDEIFLKFLEQCIHPLVLSDKEEVTRRLSVFNDLLERDGYVLKASSRISGKPVYQEVRFNVDDYIASHAIDTIESIARNFHLTARALSNRHSGRKPFEITDEYDVQDLFYALLIPFFEDIRDEEVTPSYAGSHSRMDFLIKSENIVVEVKKTRPTLKAKEVGEQLIIDKNRYHNHPNCKTFIAFVYDPDGYIKNPRGLERDLSHGTDDMRVKVFIAPS